MNPKRIVASMLFAGLALAALVGLLTHPVAALPPETYIQGTEIASLSTDDYRECGIAIGFTFNYYGADYTQLCASTNGFVTFDALASGNSPTHYQNQPLDSTAGASTLPTTLIAPYWADLMSHNSKEMVITGETGSAPNREFVVQWTNFGFYNDNTPLGTFQIILYETSNNVRFQYRKMIHPDKGFGKIGTIGLRNSATQVTQHSYVASGSTGPATLSDGQSLLFTWNGGTSSYDLDPNAAYEGLLFYKDTPPPALPQLTAPADGDYAALQPAFSWESAERTVTYTLKVANESDTSFSAPLINTAILSPTTSYAHTGAPLTEGNTYLWTVTAANAEGDAWSDVWTFTATAKTTSAISVSGSPNPSDEGQSVTFTAVVTPDTATGTVDFYAGGTFLGTETLSGGQALHATDALTPGTHAITATYGGDANLFPSISTVHTQTVQAGSEWELVGPAGFTTEDVYWPALAMDSDGIPYVAYSKMEYNSSSRDYASVLTVTHYTGNGPMGWETVGAFSSTEYFYRIFLALDSSNTPYVAYPGDYDSNAPFVVIHYTGSGPTGWETVGQSASVHDNSMMMMEDMGLGLALNSTDTPCVAYSGIDYDRDYYYDYTSYLEVQCYQNGNWELLPAVYSSTDGGYTYGSIPMVFDGNDMLYIAYSDPDNDHKATVKRYNGSTWEIVGQPGFSAEHVHYGLDLALDGNDTPYVTYIDWANDRKATVKRYNGSAWETVGQAGFSAGYLDYSIAIAVGGNNIPYVSYIESVKGTEGYYSNKGTVMRYTGSTWEALGQAGFLDEKSWVYNVRFALDHNDVPYVAYSDPNQEYRVTVKRYKGSVSLGPMVTLDKSVNPAAAHPGEAVTFALAFRNYSAVIATHVLIEDTLPAGFTVTSVLSAGARITQTGTHPYTWQVQNLTDGQGGVITLTGVLDDPQSPGELINVVRLTADGITRRSAMTKLTVLKPQAAVTLSDLAHTYDGTAKSATATTDPPGLSVALSYNGGSMPPIKPGSYTVIATVTDPDYEGSAMGTLVIGKGAAQVTLQDLARTYNGEPQKASYTTIPAEQYAALTYNGSPDAPKNAGSYTVVATVDTELYTGVATDTLVIAKAPLTVTADSLVKYVSTANPPLTWRASGFVGGEKSDVLSGVPALSTDAVTASPTGTYTITVAAGTLAATNYDLTTFVDGVLTITPKLVPEIAWDNPTPIVYGTALGAAQLNATASYEGEAVPGTFVYTPASGAVLGGGEQTLSAMFTPDDTDTYASVPAKVTLLVKRAPLTVTAEDKSKTYGAANPALSISYSGWVGSDGVSSLTALPTAETTATAATAAGVYPIVPGGGASDDYELHYVNGALTINKVALTVTANDKTRVYGAANPAFDAAYTGFVNDDTDANLEVKPTFLTTATASSPVGVYAIVPQAGESQNYTFGPLIEGKLTITTAPLTIIADDAARTDVAPNPADPTWHYDGFRVGDTSDVLTGEPAFTFGVGDGSLGAPTPLGDYAITPTVGTLAATNYTFAFESGVLHVTDRTVPTLTWVIADPIIYGTPLGAAQLNATATYSQGAVTGAYAYEPVEGMVLEAGERSLLVTFVPSDLLTFYTATQRATLVVSKTRLYVRADDQARNYGDPNPPLTVSYGDFVGSDSAADLLTPPTAATTATETTPQGAVAIVPGGGDDANYRFTYLNGELTIGEGLATVTLPDLVRTYNGQPQIVTPTTSPAGLSVNVLYTSPDCQSGPVGPTGPKVTRSAPLAVVAGLAYGSSGTCASADAPIKPGTYTVTATIDDENYTGAATGTLVIEKAVAEITLQKLTGVYNGEPHQVGYVTDPEGQYAAVTYDGLTTPPKNAGSYTVVARITDCNPLYTGVTTGTLTIGKVTLTVSAHDKIKYVGTANPAFTWDAEGFVGGESSIVLSGQPSFATSAATDSPVDMYPITLTAGTLAATNYAFSFVNGELEVTPKLVAEVTWNKPLPIVYGTPLGATQLNATATYNSQPLTGTFIYTPSAGTVLVGGEQPLRALFVPDDGDTYARVPAATSIIVQRAPLTVTAEDKSKVYGAANPALSVSYNGWVGSDGLSKLKVQPTAQTTATAATPAGMYAIVPSGGASNYYELLYVNGALTINKAALTVIANDKMRAYGAANPVFDVTYTGFVAGDTAANVTVPATGATTATVSTPPGVYAIAPGGGASSNYTFGPYVNGALTITKATLTVVADDQARNDAAANPPLTWHYEGFLAGDTSAVLTGSPALTPGAGDGSVGDPTPLGTYPITITQGALDSARYQFTFVNGELTVTPRVVPTITWATPDPIVYGTPLTSEQLDAEATDSAGTVQGQYTYEPPEWTLLDAGEHSLLVTFVPDDRSTYYTATKRVSLVVTQAPLTVTADDQARGYGMENPPLTLSYAGFVWPDNASSLINPPMAATTATATTPRGVYAIVPGGGDDANYALTYVNGALTITAADLQVLLTSSPNPSYYRQPVEFKAWFAAGLPSGTVTFYDNGEVLGTAILPGARVLGTIMLGDGVATFITDTLTVGTHHILAVYSGDANNNPGTSAPHEHVVEMPTNVIAGVGSVKIGQQILAYQAVISNPNTTPLYNVVVTGSIPAQAAFVSVAGGSRVAGGGDYGNGYVTSGVIPELAPDDEYILTWAVQPLAIAANMSTLAHATSLNAQADLTLSIQIYKFIFPAVRKSWIYNP